MLSQLPTPTVLLQQPLRPPHGYLVVRTTSSTQPVPVNGVNYPPTTATAIGFILNSGTATTFASTGLVQNTDYYYWIFPFNTTSCAGPVYATTGILSGMQTTATAGKRQALISGNWNAAATWQGGIIPTLNDSVYIPDGVDVILNISGNAYHLSIGDGVSGSLIYDAISTRTLTVASSIYIAPNGTLSTALTGTGNLGHSLTVYQSIVNDGTLDLCTNGNNIAANLSFTGDNNAELSGNGPVTDIRTISINKFKRDNILEIKPSNFTVQGAVTDVASFINFSSVGGTLKISGTFTMTNRVFSVPTYNIPLGAGFWLNNPNFTVAAQAGATNCFTAGLLRMSQGTYNIGLTGADEMGSATNSTFIIEGGTINAMRWALNSGSTYFNMSGGTMNLGAIANTRVSYATFDLAVSSSVFIMSGGTINITNAARNASPFDWKVGSSAGNYTVTGGLVNFGNAATVTDTLFRVSGPIPSFVLDNTVHNKNMVLTQATIAFGDITIHSGDTLNTNSFNLTQNGGNSFTNDGTILTTPGSSRLILTGASPRFFTGTGTTGTNLLPVQNFDIDVAGGLTLDPLLTNNIITNRITLINGNITNAGKITLGTGSTTVAPAFIVGNATAASNPGTIHQPFTFNIGTAGQALQYLKFLNPRTMNVEINPTRNISSLIVDNNSGAALTLAGGDLNISTTLTLTNGVINTSATSMIGIGSSISLNRTNGWVKGPFKRTLVATGFTVTDPRALYPEGTATTYRPIRIYYSIAPTVPGTLTVEHIATDPGNNGLPLTESSVLLNNYGKEGYWTATAAGGLTGGTYGVELTAQGFTISGTPSEARVIKRTNSSSPWTLQGSHSAATGNVIRRTGLTGFSEFGVAYFDAVLLPVTLINFNGTRNNGINTLNWQTVSESNNKGFDLQRSIDGINFSSVAFISSKAVNGNSNTTLNYFYNDAPSQKTSNYYRLKQADFDNRTTTSRIILIKGEQPNAVTLSIVYPNPALNSLNLVISLPAPEKVDIAITGVTGNVLKQQTLNAAAGDNSSTIDISKLPRGTYFVKLTCASGCQAETKRFVKQ